ncbi:hypothetical protein EI42_06377 [Thermosporothrix hazakensis]|jgi:quercetin dioxygenase-like cupin family protein|uniref:Cupin n=2 Tax=Thermosporothrix TaxID=768650 RepID=A0A326TRJ0_THEHA|nr:cupin domain-containing protein [Thermosporothrix hazakensis]PZW18063.1 hypothetical protein EI42_06377 [Thermosporothrix hazakensis]BBH85330.1 cupin [Thermosporothrix sp. COM3]GCE46239.1 cupin [Thermosporothrix hazakensis]
MATIQKKHFSKPDETRTLPKTRIEVLNVGDNTIMKTTFEPGWRWSEHVKPTVGTSSCQIPHLSYTISGHLKLQMEDGTQEEIGPGDIADIPPGHDAWVIGDDPYVGIDFTGGRTYGQKAT